MDDNKNMEQPMNQEPAPEQKTRSKLATAGMVLGIIAIATSFIPIVNNASFVLGILALIFGAVCLVKRRSKGKAITALVTGILAVAITLAMQSAVDKALNDLDEDLDRLTGEKTDDILQDSLDVTIGKFQVIQDEYWEDTKLTVTLKNKSKEKQSFSVTVEAVDKDGVRLAVDYIHANDLGAGQSQRFDIFTLVTSEDIAAMKDATFRVVEVSAY